MRRLRRQVPTPAGAAVAAVYLGFVAISLLQQPGRTTYDTRLELTERPGSFLASAFSLWQPDVNLGELQNQANGYLFPQGPFFWLGDLLQVAPWFTQRVWSALVVIVACEGMRRVGRALDLPASAAFLGGLVFALSPRLLGTSGVLTAEALPGAMAPWVLLPLLLTVRGRLPVRSAVVLSAAAAVSMGGVNAVETGAALVPAAVLIIWAVAGRLLPWRLGVAWVGAVALATLWWTLPLLVLGRFSPPFYEYVESATTTTSFVGWSEAIRGNSHWLSWTLLPDGRPWWPAAHDLATEPVLVGVSAMVTAAGLVGLARWRSQFRVPFAFSAATGIAVITVAHGGLAGSPVAGAARSALDGVLQIFRNVHKFDPSVRLAVAIGVAALFAEVVARVDSRTSVGATGKWVVIPACVVLVLGAPYVNNAGRTPGWSSIPDPWVDARDWLADHGVSGGVLILPASGFAIQGWGATIDEPALALDIRRRVALTQAPLLPGPSLRFLSALTTSIGTATAGAVADQLSRAGISHVVLRGDLDPTETGTPGPQLAEAALTTAGIDEVATFGAGTAAPLTIYEVNRGQSRLRTLPADRVLTVAGQPESVLAVQEAGLATGAVVLKGEAGWARPPDVVTDGAQRRERQFGSLYGSRSVVLQAAEPYRTDRAAHDYPGVPGVREVVAEYDGLASLRASSSRGYADTFGEVVPAEGPAAAIDNVPATRWVTSPASEPTRQWLRLTFPEPRSVRRVTVQPVVGDRALAPVRRVEVAAGAQRQSLDVSPSGARVVAHFDGRPVSAVTIRIREVGTVAERAPVALADVRVDDLVPRATLRVPEPLGKDTGFVFRTDPGTRPCVLTPGGPNCDEARRRTAEEPAGLDRTVHVPSVDTVDVRGAAMARTTRRALRLLEPVGSEQRVRASSVLGNDPRVSSRFAWDGSPETAWMPADSDAGPTLVFRWSTAHRISGIRVESPDPQTTPTRALVTAGDGRQVEMALDGSAASAFPEVRTRKLKVTFQRPAEGARIVVREVDLIGADVTQPFDRDAVTGAICGLGPHVVVDGAVHHSEVRGTLGDIVDGRPMQLTVCDPDEPDGGDPRVLLGPGEHRISAPMTAEFQTTLLVGSPSNRAAVPTTPRTIDTTSWRGTRRVANVGPGAAAVVWMPANANPGWRATLAGKELAPVRVDGWQQGWMLPAGAGGRLVIDYPPQQWYGALVIVGLVPAGLTVVLALLLILFRRPRGMRNGHAPTPGPPLPTASAVLAAVLMPALGGASAVGAALGWAGRRTSLPVVAGGLFVLISGLLDAVAAGAPDDGFADLLAACGFGLLLASALADREEGR